MQDSNSKRSDDESAGYLARRLACPVLGPRDVDYQRARRVWNSAIDRNPVAVIQCGDQADAINAVRVLRDAAIPFTVRGGGHNVAGNAVRDGAVLLDLSRLRSLVFDAEDQTVTVGGGCVWGEVDRAGADGGWVVPTGMISHTGVAGLTLGGGTGYLTRRLGTTSDSLLQADVVLADGSVVSADGESNPDLFWALRGAGHNFGLVTAFKFRVHPLSAPVFVRQSIFGSSSRSDVLAFYRDWAPTQPRALTSYVNLLRIPPYWPWLPASHHGETAVNVTSVFYGSAAEGKRLTNLLHGVGAPLWTESRVMRHAELQRACDDDWRWGVHHYWKPSFLSGIPDEAIEAIIHWCDLAPPVYEQARSKISPQPINHFEINYRGGALGDADPSASAYSDRVSPYNMNIQAIWTRPEDAAGLLDWAGGFAESLMPHWSGAYANFMSDQGTAPVAERIFGRLKYERLVAIKDKYDPDNIFSGGGIDLTRKTVPGDKTG